MSDGWKDEDDQPRFASGDQDYDSAIGWGEPDVKKMVEESKKKAPRHWARVPEILEVHPIGEWQGIAENFDPASDLFGPFWRRGELAILFGGTGSGKSALAAQIGESLARGRAIDPFTREDGKPADTLRVLLVDFEMRADQFAMRYAPVGADGLRTGPYYEFSTRMMRCELHWNGDVIEGYDGFSDMFFTSLINVIRDHQSDVVILDNITFLDRASTSNANTALSIMRALKQLKRQEDISILVVAHTPKRRPWTPVTELDLQGSINLANFADSVFAVARSRMSQEIRYLKQIKSRSGRLKFADETVPIFAFEKYDLYSAMRHGPELPGGRQMRNFLGFRFIEYSNEQDHLEEDPVVTQQDGSDPMQRSAFTRKVKHLAAAGASYGSVSRQTGVPKTTVFRHAKRP